MIEVLSSGIGTCFQDLGRFGFRKFGVPISGAMDRNSVILCNQVLGNDPNAPVVEFALKGPTLRFHASAVICISGADFKSTINNVEISNNQCISISKGDELTFGKMTHGVYGYLAVQAGFNVKKILNSVSYYPTLSDQHNIKKGDFLQFYPNHLKRSSITASIKIPVEDSEKNEIEVFPGPEYERLPLELRQYLFSNEMILSKEISRMGYRLSTNLAAGMKEIITAPVQPGTVQLTPSGQLIVLMRDAQTTGGYARIFQLSEKAISKLAQNRPGASFRFALQELD